MAQGAMNNMLRFAYSYQDEPRSFDGPLFPTKEPINRISMAIAMLFVSLAIYAQRFVNTSLEGAQTHTDFGQLPLPAPVLPPPVHRMPQVCPQGRSLVCGTFLPAS